MTKKKILTLLLCLALIVSMTLPTTLAVSSDSDSTSDVTPEEPVMPIVEGGEGEEPEIPEEPGDPEDPEQPEEPVEDPMEEPEEPETPEDPMESAHIDTCSDDCTDEDCQCPCHTGDEQEPEDYTEFYDQLMAAETADAFYELLATLPDEEIDAFRAWLTENGLLDSLEAHLDALEAVSEPAELPVISFTNIGPLLAAPASPVRRPLRAASRAAGDNGVVLNKTAKANADGSYTITLEAYATGASSTVTSTAPVDIVLVLDVSGSMDDSLSGGHYEEVYNVTPNDGQTYYIRRNGNYTELSWDGESWGYYSGIFGFWWNPVSPKTAPDDSDSSHRQFYVYVSSTKKIDALKSAVNSFIDNVGTQSPDSSIAIVKFAGDKTNRVGNDTYREGWYTYNYSQIVRNLTTVSGNVNTLKSAVNSLRPAGATRADCGMEHAQSIISSVSDDGRKKVVIMFTDGEPTSQNSFETGVANAAISASKSIKDAGATVYTIGVFSGANGTPVSGWYEVSDTNKYMHLVSSNYKNATGMYDTGAATYPDGGKSYYLSAGSAAELQSIFEQISQEVGGSTVKLDSTSYILDTVTDQFTMPEGADAVAFYTMDCNGQNQFDLTTKTSAAGVRYTVTGNTLEVTGFDFSANWCGPRDGVYGGKKLIVEFTVTPRDGFLGGNDVFTNAGADDGIYDGEDTQLGEFDSPSVNVPIKAVTVTAEDKNVYLLGSVTADQIKNGATVKVGDVELKLSKADYGLEAWQTEYVNITVTITDAAGNSVTDLTNLTDDTTYTVTAVVSPKTNGANAEGTPAAEQSDSATGKINVFKPELTFKDSNAYYGEDVPANNDYSGNQVGVETWKHGTQADGDVVMLGTKPQLGITYTPDASKIENGKYTKQDVPVKADVTINGVNVNDHTTFVHQDCVPACDWTTPAAKGDPAFLIHIRTCSLTVAKQGGAADESYVFIIYKDGVKYSEVTVWGNGSETLVELPVGTYTVEEDTGWSWRYTPSYSGGVALSAVNTSGTITCTNTKTNDYWLNGFSNVVRNIFGHKEN